MDSALQTSVAVIIPCFEHGRFLADAVRSAVDQLRVPDEIIVVDDGGSENLGSILAPFSHVQLIRQDNSGLAAARNRGLSASKCDKLVFLDADDRLLPNALEAGLRCFRENANAAFVYGGYEEVASGRSQTRLVPVCDRRDLVRCNCIGMIAAAMFDRRKLLAAGGFDERLGMCEDWDAYLRLSREYGFAAHPEIVAVYRKHGANMSDDVPQLLRSHVQMFQLLVSRLRGSERRVAMRQLSRWRARLGLVLLRRSQVRDGVSNIVASARTGPLSALGEVLHQLRLASFPRRLPPAGSARSFFDSEPNDL